MSVAKQAEKPLSSRRQRKFVVLRSTDNLKKWGWRATALWSWLHIIGWSVGRRDILGSLEQRVFSAAVSLLSAYGFQPNSEWLLGLVVKILWVLVISDFSFMMLALLGIYIMLWPFLIPVFLRYAKAMDASRRVALQGLTSQPLFRLTPALLSCLIAWFILYARTSNRGPLLAAVVICGLLLGTGLMRASLYSTAVDIGRKTRVEQIVRASSDYLIQVLKGLRLGGTKLKGQLRFSRTIALFSLRMARMVSIFLRGTAGRRRASLLVLAQYTATLSVLGLMIVLFWGLVIKYSLAPANVPLRAGLLASASHVIPGVVDTTNLAVNVYIQSLASATAWLVLVIFAGPAASNFPLLQERFISRMKIVNSSILLDRRRLYHWVVLCDVLTNRIEQNAALDEAFKLILIIAAAEKFGGLQMWQPEVEKALCEAPELSRALREAGVPVPQSVLRMP